MDIKETAKAEVEHNQAELLQLSHRLHADPEIAFGEVRSSGLVRDQLDTAGFEIVPVDSDIPTAFVAHYGTGSLNVGICAEYDALPGIGHACGHNIIAAAAVGAALALKAVAAELDLTVTVWGTPAEEGGGGKILMLQKGMFDGVHLAMMVHPYAAERDAMGTLAVSQLYIDYTGKAAHAAAHPEQGRNAASALALAQVGLGMLREHIPDTDRIHGIVLKGGDAPNIVPGNTRGRWFIRSRTTEGLLALEPKVFDVFKGAALMTGCDVTIRKSAPSYSELKTDATLAALWRDNAERLGRTSLPLQPGDSAASTDMGNVSFAMPTIHPLIAIDAHGANIHEAGFAEHAVSKSADDAIIYGATAMAWTAIDAALDDATRKALQAHEFVATELSGADAAFLGRDFETPITYSPALD